MEIRDLETLGPLVASSLRSDATAQGPRVSKSRISMDSPYNLYVDERNGGLLYSESQSSACPRLKRGVVLHTSSKLLVFLEFLFLGPAFAAS